MQDVPVAVLAITGDDATRRGVLDTSALAQMVPGLTFNRQSTSATPFLRGVGSQNGTIGNESSVAIYVDDVYINTGFGSLFDFNNIARIEVLKGPQGTLFGRNATGGVINVITRDPSPTPSVDVSAGYANYSTYNMQLYATGRITDEISANVAAYGRKQDEGWGRNLASGDPTYTGWASGVRTKALWQPSEDTDILLSFDFNKERTELGLNLVPIPGTFGALAERSPPGFYDSYSSPDNSSTVRQVGGSLKLTNRFDWATLKSISAYRDTRAHFNSDQDGTPIVLLDAQFDDFDHDFTQELQLLSPAQSSLKWIVGAFFLSGEAGYDPLRLSGKVISLPYVSYYSNEKTTSISTFGQSTANVLPDTNLTLGLRYTRDKQEMDIFHNLGGLGDSPEGRDSATFPKLTYRASLDHHFSSDIMGYVSYNRGFKSGVYNLIQGPSRVSPFGAPVPIAPPVRPEVLDAYAIGMKSEFLDHSVRVDVEGFYYRYSNLQVIEVQSGAAKTVNAAAAKIKGVDLDIEVVPLPRLTLAGGVSVLDGRYKSFPNGQENLPNPPNAAIPYPAGCPLPPPVLVPTVPGNTQIACNLAGHRTIDSPTVSSTLSSDYRLPVPIGEIDFNVAWSHTASYFFEPDNGLAKQPAVDMVDASIGLAAAKGRWDMRVWGKNLLQKHYYSYAVEGSLQGNVYSGAPPRTFGVTASMHF